MIDPQTQQIRNVTQKILDRIAIDPQFRQQMVNDPGGTLEKSEFSQELQQLAKESPTKVTPQLRCDRSCVRVNSCWWTSFWTN
jgi:hypothetical protein